jgi:hypothetical protein
MEILPWSIAFFRNATSSVVRLNFVGTGTGVTLIFTSIAAGVGVTAAVFAFWVVVARQPPSRRNSVRMAMKNATGKYGLIGKTVHY